MGGGVVRQREGTTGAWRTGRERSEGLWAIFARAGAHLRVEVAHVERRILVAVHRLLTEEVGSGAGGDAPARESHGRHRASAGEI